MVTRKEHPVESLVVFSIHECQIKKLMPAFVCGAASGAAKHVLFQWVSILLPSTLRIEAFNSVELARRLVLVD